MVEPGWYHRQGDPPGSRRYWDGELWQGPPVFGPPGPPARGTGPLGYYPESSQATTALVLGILGLLMCGVLGPIAWYVGNQEIRAIDAGRRDPSNRGTAQAGRVMGIIVTVLLGLGLFTLAVLVAAAI